MSNDKYLQIPVDDDPLGPFQLCPRCLQDPGSSSDVFGNKSDGVFVRDSDRIMLGDVPICDSCYLDER